MKQPMTSSPRLRLERIFAAPRSQVFNAWTNPEVLRRWWAAGPEWDGVSADVDLRVGGRYRLSMRDPASDAEHTVIGEYTEVRPPERLAYTWAWEPGAGDRQSPHETHVTVEFREDGKQTTVVITHEGFLDEASRDRHRPGWQGCLANLQARVFDGAEAGKPA